MASMMVMIGARTERHPFIAQAHGISELSILPRIFRPEGKGMPIKKPSGIRIRNTRIILTGMECKERKSETAGRKKL